MDKKINITDIIDANAHNSTMALVAKWSNLFKKYALNETEELSDSPGNSFNVFTHLTAHGAAKMMFEQAMRINEATESTAILPKTLLNKLTMEEMQGVFGTPASTTIAFCIKKDDIIKHAILEDQTSTMRTYKLIINKNMQIVFESHPVFTLPYDVEIVLKESNTIAVDPNSTNTQLSVSPYNIFANYIIDYSLDSMRPVYNILKHYISTRELVIDNEIYVTLFLKAFQMVREEREFYVSDPNTVDQKITFNDSLIGVEVFRTKVNTKEEILMDGYIEGSTPRKDSYLYSYDYKRNKQNINIIFNKAYETDRNIGRDKTLQTGDKIRIVTYTTSGELGNIEFPKMLQNLDHLLINYNQDLRNIYQNAMLNMVTLAFARDERSSGGRNQMSFEEIRQTIIDKKYSRNILITNNEIVAKGRTMGLDVEKIRHDIVAVYYRATDIIRFKNMTLSTGTNTLTFDLEEKEKLIGKYNYYLIEPTDVFKYDTNKNRFVYVPHPQVFLEYTNTYNNAVDVDSINQVCFPFYIRYDNVKHPKLHIYDMYMKNMELLFCTDYNENVSLDKLDISYLKIDRNPFRGNINGMFKQDEANTYYISFIVYTGTNTLNKIYDQARNNEPTLNYVNSSIKEIYDKQFLLFDIELEGRDEVVFQLETTRLKIINIDTMLNDGYIAYQATFTTDNYINQSMFYLTGIRNKNKIPTEYSYSVPEGISTEFKFRIRGRFNYKDGYGVKNTTECVVYETDYIQFVRYYNDAFGIEFDIETSLKTYDKYPTRIYDRWETTVYKKNPNYDPDITDQENVNYYPFLIEKNGSQPIFNKKMIGEEAFYSPQFVVLHNKGDYRFTYTPYEGIYDEKSTRLKEFYKLLNGDTETDPTYHEYELVPDILNNRVPGVIYYTASCVLHEEGENVVVDENELYGDTMMYYIGTPSASGIEYVGYNNLESFNNTYNVVDNATLTTGFEKYKIYYIQASPILYMRLNTYDYESDTVLMDVDPSETYYTRTTEYYKKVGDKYILLTREELEAGPMKYENVSNTPATFSLQNTQNVLVPENTKYTGVIKNVPWINRIYMSSENNFSIIRDQYMNLINSVKMIKEQLFDGGIIYASLKRTAGKSLQVGATGTVGGVSKYSAQLMSTGVLESLNNIAIKIHYVVKFKENTSLEYKRQQIIDITVKYIDELGDDNLSFDGLFEFIKANIPDVDYINIKKLNKYDFGEVQTIINNSEYKNEILTVSQKVITDSDGELTFVPDITVDILNYQSEN